MSSSSTTTLIPGNLYTLYVFGNETIIVLDFEHWIGTKKQFSPGKCYEIINEPLYFLFYIRETEYIGKPGITSYKFLHNGKIIYFDHEFTKPELFIPQP